jgi:hypothetical protein
MSSISCDSIMPKHGSYVTINGAYIAPPVWSTAVATATAGPFTEQSTATATIQWSIDNDDMVTVLIPEIEFVGLNHSSIIPPSLKFAAVAGLPAPQYTAMAAGLAYQATSPGYMLQTQTRIHLDKRIEVMISILSEGKVHVLKPVVVRYKANPFGDWTPTGDATATVGPVSAPGVATWMMYYCTEPIGVHFSIPWNLSFKGDDSSEISFSVFTGLPNPPMTTYFTSVMANGNNMIPISLALATDSSLKISTSPDLFTDNDLFSINEITGSYAS